MEESQDIVAEEWKGTDQELLRTLARSMPSVVKLLLMRMEITRSIEWIQQLLWSMAVHVVVVAWPRGRNTSFVHAWKSMRAMCNKERGGAMLVFRFNAMPNGCFQ
jgi:hypothetical protein